MRGRCRCANRGIHFHLDVLVPLRGRRKRSRRRCVGARSSRRRLAHQAMHTRSRCAGSRIVAAADLERGALDARDSPETPRALPCGSPCGRSTSRTCARASRPVLRLGAARARLDVHEAVVRVERVGETCGGTRDRRLPFRAWRRPPRCGEGRACSPLAPFSKRPRESRNDEAIAASPVTVGVQRLLFPAEVLRALGVVPDLGIGQERFSTSVRRFCLPSKSKIPPQLCRPLVQVRERRGDLIDAFGFHRASLQNAHYRHRDLLYAGRRKNFRRSCLRKSSSPKARPRTGDGFSGETPRYWISLPSLNRSQNLRLHVRSRPRGSCSS